ncbi:ribonuclease H2 subunit B [Anopheles darlingi]|uniref:ribonuclease H2 subunit B n=1 Tax=Anopheles darlingi TaxID=43151 RepID=UPI002100064D|nr:ribonuclease H2 subunit B [Anopheles darlingi]
MSTKFFFILKGDIIENGDSSLQVVSLRNPATKSESKYLLQKDAGDAARGTSVYEVNCFNEPHRSWFINETVCSNGKIFLPTPIDPLFLLLPYLEQHCTERAVPLEQVLIDDEFPRVAELAEALKPSRISLLADEKRAGNIVAYRYNESKALSWLVSKCHRLSVVVSTQDGSAARSKNFIKEEKENEVDGDETAALQTAFGLVSDYLSLEMGKKLANSLGFPEDDNVSKKRKSIADLESVQVKRIKKEEIHETTPIKLQAPEKKVSAKAKALAKAASGSKSISSFFKK